MRPSQDEKKKKHQLQGRYYRPTGPVLPPGRPPASASPVLLLRIRRDTTG